MKKFTKLNERDIIQILADYYNADRDQVRLKIENRLKGYGPTKRRVPKVIAIIQEE